MQVHRSRFAFLAMGLWVGVASASFGGTSIDDDTARREMTARIDALLQQQWSAANVEPAPLATDGEFLRRAYLDLTGVIPRASEVREFLADERPEKRALLVDQLLASPRHATHMATTWRNRILPLGVDPARSREAMGLQKWLRTRFAGNLRYDNLVGELLLTIGGDELGPALYFQANDLSPEKLAASSAELFLGLKLECAQCHDHPYSDWSQRDFWGLAAFFARVKAPADGRGMMMASYRIVDADRGEVRLPESDEIVRPKYPRGKEASDEVRRTRRTQLAIWMTSRDNDYFARAAVNWAWTHLFGVALIESLDHLDDEDASIQLQILDELARYFVASDFDLRDLWQTLAATRAYHLSSRPIAGDSAGPHLFARMLAKPLTPEQLYDSFIVLSPPRATYAVGYAQAQPAGSLDEDPARAEFVRRMRPPPGSATEYRAGTLQALMLMNGPLTGGVTAHDRSHLVGALDAPFMDESAQVESLFLAVLARPPDEDEQRACIAALQETDSPDERQRALSDIMWALVNSTEFAFNH